MIGAFAVSVFLSNERPIFLVHSNYYQFTLVLTIACTLLVQQIMVTRGESHFLFSRIQLEFGVAFPAPAHLKPHHDAYEVVLSLPGEEMTVCAG
jgi:hypothetical protein